MARTGVESPVGSTCLDHRTVDMFYVYDLSLTSMLSRRTRSTIHGKAVDIHCWKRVVESTITPRTTLSYAVAELQRDVEEQLKALPESEREVKRTKFAVFVGTPPLKRSPYFHVSHPYHYTQSTTSSSPKLPNSLPTFPISPAKTVSQLSPVWSEILSLTATSPCS